MKITDTAFSLDSFSKAMLDQIETFGSQTDEFISGLSKETNQFSYAYQFAQKFLEQTQKIEKLSQQFIIGFTTIDSKQIDDIAQEFAQKFTECPSVAQKVQFASQFAYQREHGFMRVYNLTQLEIQFLRQ